MGVVVPGGVVVSAVPVAQLMLPNARINTRVAAIRIPGIFLICLAFLYELLGFSPTAKYNDAAS
jgi:hypothetical protein